MLTKGIKKRLKIFNGKFARRLFILFICCAMLPIVVLSLVSLGRVSLQLKEQSGRQLRRAVKTHAIAIYDRLNLLEAQIDLICLHLEGKDSSQSFGDPDLNEDFRSSLKDRFIAISRTAEGRVYPLYGDPIVDKPNISPLAENQFKLGKSIILTQKGLHSIKRRIFLTRLIATGRPELGSLLAEINTNYLWSIGLNNTLPSATHFSAFDSDLNILVNSNAISTTELRKQIRQATIAKKREFEFDQSGDSLTVSFWPLFLEAKFVVDDWIIVFSQSSTQFLAPMTSFKRTFLLITLLSFWVVLLFSIRYIRKASVPLDRLKSATVKLSHGDFDHAVVVKSGDEFEDVTSAFNVMTRQLGRQFSALSTLAHIGQQTASVLETRHLLDVVLKRMEETLNFKQGCVFLVQQEPEELCLAAGYGLSRENLQALEQTRIDLGGHSLAEHPDFREIFNNGRPHIRTCPQSDKLAEKGTIICPLLDSINTSELIVAPIVYENRPYGILAVAKDDDSPGLSREDESVITGISAQLASALFAIAAYRRLENSEKRFKNVFSHAASGMALLTLEGKFVEVNPPLCRMLGYEPSALLNRRLDQMFHQDEWDAIKFKLDRLLSVHTEAVLEEVRMLNSRGETMWALMSASLLHDDNGQHLHFILHLQDLTVQKKIELEKQNISRQLQQSQKMESLGTLAGGIAHDFNNILSGIMGYSELAKLEVSDQAKCSEKIDMVLKATHRAKDLVQQILTFSRQDNQPIQPVKVSTIAKEVLKFLRASIPPEIDIQSNIDNDDDPVMTDPTQIHQIVMNLCTNAYQAMLDTGGLLQFSLKTVSVDADDRGSRAVLSHGSYTEVRVSDTGHGIDEQTAGKIFEPYFTTKEKGKGTGLGLSVVHGIVEKCGGSISVQSAPGKGTTFTVLLPQKEATAVSAKDDAEPMVGTEKILFVDDEEIIIDMALEMLERLGYTATCLQNPQTAIKRFMDSPDDFDLVITDMSMPGIKGDKLAEKIYGVRPDIPIILCSGFNEGIDKDQTSAVGVTGILPKPFTLRGLNEAIRSALTDSASSPDKPNPAAETAGIIGQGQLPAGG
ncbi:MAG: PAS domain S-box protein [Desulfuromonadaceae bacterium]|nr:PAS domain S-box protein [Desulfuromonadaceae bacterium]